MLNISKSTFTVYNLVLYNFELGGGFLISSLNISKHGGTGGTVGGGGGGGGVEVCLFILSTQGAPGLMLLKQVFLDCIGNFNESSCLILGRLSTLWSTQ